MGSTPRRERRYRTTDRGQSNTIGFVLTIALVIAGSTVILLIGGVSLSDARQSMEVQRAEKIMTEFDSRSAMVALGDARSQSIDLSDSLDSGYEVRDDVGWMRVNVTNTTTGNEKTIMNVSLGNVEYRNGDVTIAYQGGGVWRRTGRNGSTMVSPPEFHYRGATLTLPMVVVDGDGSSSSKLTVERNGSIQRVYPNVSDDRRNPLENGRVSVTVHSDYYQAWGDFFGERTDGDAAVDHGAETATVTLVVPSNRPAVAGGVVSGAVSATLEINQNAQADSYNSSVGPYSGGSSNTRIIAAGDVEVQNNAIVDGNLEVGSDVTLSNNAEVHGNISFGDSLSLPPNFVINGWTAPNASVSTPTTVAGVIDQKRSTFASSNDNASEADVIDDLENGNSCGGVTYSCDLSAGDYYLDSFTLSGNTLVMDTTGGNIDIVVDGDMEIANDNIEIQVVGSNRVNIYLEGDMQIWNGEEVDVPGDRSPQFWVYMNPGSKADLEQNAIFTGVIYGPGSSSNPGVDPDLENNAEVFGAIVGDADGLDNNFVVHYDEALAQEEPVLVNSALPSVTYLHISVNRVNVTSE